MVDGHITVSYMVSTCHAIKLLDRCFHHDIILSDKSEFYKGAVFDMKKMIAFYLALVLAFTLVGCSKGNVDNVKIADWEASEIYSDEDIQSAITVVKEYFKSEFEGCTLTSIRYPGDRSANEFNEWAEQYEADEAIVLYSSFDVDASGGDGSLNPNSTYNNWKWILTRNINGSWEHKTHGYG